MKRSATIAAMAASAIIMTSCGGETNPVQTAVMEKIIAENPEVVKFEFTKFEQVKQVSLSYELDRRQSLFETKEKVNAKKAAEYSSKNMQQTAMKRENQRKSAEEILERIEYYRENHAGQMDSIIYVVYTYDGFGKMADGSKVIAEGQYATVSPDGKVYTLQPAGGNPSKGMGIAIPGYLEEIIGRIEGLEGEL